MHGQAGATAAFTKEQQRRLADREGRFGDGRAPFGGGLFGDALQERRKKLMAMQLAAAADDGAGGAAAEPDWDLLTIKGTCQNLEKSYFRLTSAPDASTVRPENVLREALARLKSLNPKPKWLYLNDQLKAMRQDLTVQRIRNGLTAAVYEHHGREALEYGDLAEYNQCQTALKALYKEGVEGCKAEFIAYRVIYYAVKGTESAHVSDLKEALSPQWRAEACVAHALAVRGAIKLGDAAAFFKLFAAAPNLGRALMDAAVEKARARTRLAECFCRAITRTVVSLSCSLATPFPLVFLRCSLPPVGPAEPLPRIATHLLLTQRSSLRVSAPNPPQMRFQALTIATRAYAPTVPVLFLGRMLGFAEEVAAVSGASGAALAAAAAEVADEAVAEAAAAWMRAHGAVVTGEETAALAVDCKARGAGLGIPLSCHRAVSLLSPLSRCARKRSLLRPAAELHRFASCGTCLLASRFHTQSPPITTTRARRRARARCSFPWRRTPCPTETWTWVRLSCPDGRSLLRCGASLILVLSRRSLLAAVACPPFPSARAAQ